MIVFMDAFREADADSDDLLNAEEYLVFDNTLNAHTTKKGQWSCDTLEH